MRTFKQKASVVMLLTFASARAALAGEVIEVKISDIAFSPAEISAHVGDTVVFTNADIVDHTATERAEGWDVLIEAGKSGQLTLKDAGTFDYFCRFHPNMTGTIKVTAK